MKHRTFTEGMIFRILLAAAIGVGIISLPGQTAYASVPAAASASARIDVLSPQCVTDLSLTISDTPDPVSAGSVLAYTLTVTNHGPETAYNVSVSDPLPPGTTFRSLAAPSGWACTTPVVGAAGTVTCSKSSMSVGTRQFALSVNVAPDYPRGTVLTNTATVSSPYDQNPANNTGTATTQVTEDPSITSADQTTFEVGVAGQFTVTATGYPEPSLTLTGALPAGVTFTDQGGGSASFDGTPAPGSVGTYPVTIHADGGAGVLVSQLFTLTVVKTTPAVSLGAALSPAIIRPPVILTAALAADHAPGAGIPTGSVDFYNGDTLLATATIDANGLASVVVPSLPAGPYSITAVYSGDSNFTPGQQTTPVFVPWRVVLVFVAKN